MNRTWLPAALVSLSAAMNACVSTPPTRGSATAELAITQEYLVPVCLDGSAVDPERRRWDLAPGRRSMTFTMRNAPREGMGDADLEAGRATVTFELEAGGTYQVEIRAPTLSYSRRTWIEGDWRPVVRQRDPDRIVSGAPAWDISCGVP